MNPDTLPVPDFGDISAEATAAAQAAMNRNTILRVPEEAVATLDNNTGHKYLRWTEPAVITNVWRETTKSGLLAAVVQLKIRVGSHNGGATIWARHNLDMPILYGQVENPSEGHLFMNNMSINALTTLLNATGLMPESGGISGKLLNFLFPQKNTPGVTSQLKGKAVILNLQDGPRKNAKAGERQTQVETYLPDEG